MHIDEVKTLFRYNSWANERIMDSTRQAGDSLFGAPAESSHGSLRGTLVHILSAEWVWRVRAQEGESPTGLLGEADFPTVASVQERWQAEDRAMWNYLNSLDDVNQTIQYRTTKGTPYESTLWHILLHIVNHGTQFRSEAGMLLSRYDCSPGDVDLIFYLRD